MTRTAFLCVSCAASFETLNTRLLAFPVPCNAVTNDLVKYLHLEDNILLS